MVNRSSIEITSAPAVEPVSASDAKSWMKVDTSADDTLIAELIVAARQDAEGFLRKKLITQTLKLTLDRFPMSGKEEWWDGVREGHRSEILGQSDKIELPFEPLQSVTSLTTYDDANSGTVYSSSNYLVDTASGRIILNNGQVWPTDLRDSAAVEIVYIVGYGDAATDVPMAIRTAIKQHVQAMYDGRTICDMPASCTGLLKKYRRMDGLTVNG